MFLTSSLAANPQVAIIFSIKQREKGKGAVLDFQMNKPITREFWFVETSVIFIK